MPVAVDFEAIEYQAKRTPLADVVERLQELLDTAGLAYLAGLTDGQMIAKWKRGTKPQGATKLRLRHAFHAALLIEAAYDDETVQVWFFGSNTRLDGEAPARVLRLAKDLEGLRLVVPAATAFARAGG